MRNNNILLVSRDQCQFQTLPRDTALYDDTSQCHSADTPPQLRGGSSPSSPHILLPMLTVVVSVKLPQGMVNVSVVIVSKEIQSCVAHSLLFELCIPRRVWYRHHIGFVYLAVYTASQSD